MPGDSDDEKPKKTFVVKTPADLQRLKLEKLMKNPEKPVIIPERPKPKGMGSVPEFVRNVMGSSAGAGSGEFHVYRHLRRKEYARQKIIQEKGKKEMLDEEYQKKLEDNKRLAEEVTAKKRAKRLKKKQKFKNKKLKIKGEAKGVGEESDSSSSEDESTDEKMEEEKPKKSIANIIMISESEISAVCTNEKVKNEINSLKMSAMLDEKIVLNQEKCSKENLIAASSDAQNSTMHTGVQTRKRVRTRRKKNKENSNVSDEGSAHMETGSRNKNLDANDFATHDSASKIDNQGNKKEDEMEIGSQKEVIDKNRVTAEYFTSKIDAEDEQSTNQEAMEIGSQKETVDKNDIVTGNNTSKLDHEEQENKSAFKFDEQQNKNCAGEASNKDTPKIDADRTCEKDSDNEMKEK